MPQQEKRTGTAGQKRNSWVRGNGPCSYRGELKRGISLNKKYLNRKVRHSRNDGLVGKSGWYRKICRTSDMVDFS